MSPCHPWTRRSTDVRFRYRVARPCQLLGQGLRVGSSGLSSRTVRETASDNRLTSSFNHDPRRPRRRVCSVVGQLFRRGEASPTRPLSPYRLERTWRGGETFAYIDRQFSARTNPRDAFRLPFPGREVDASLSPLPVPIPTLVYPSRARCRGFLYSSVFLRFTICLRRGFSTVGDKVTHDFGSFRITSLFRVQFLIQFNLLLTDDSFLFFFKSFFKNVFVSTYMYQNDIC